MLPRNVKVLEKLLLLRPYSSSVMISSGDILKFIGMIFDFAGDIRRPEKVLNFLNKSRILVILSASPSHLSFPTDTLPTQPSLPPLTS